MNDGGNSDDEWALICEETEAIVEQVYANRSLSAIQPPPTPTIPPQQNLRQPSQTPNGYTFNNFSTIAPNPPSNYSRSNDHPLHQRQGHDSYTVPKRRDNYDNSVVPQFGASLHQNQHIQHHPPPQQLHHQVNYQSNVQQHVASQFQTERRGSRLHRASQFRNIPQNPASQYRPHNQPTGQQRQPSASPQVSSQYPSARDLATAKGALENYKRKYQKMEQENMQLRAKLAAKTVASVPEKVSTDERTMAALKSDLATARNAARKAEQRAEFAERELSSREEANEFIEATQIQAPPSQGISMVRSTPRAPILSQKQRITAPSTPKRRRPSVPPISPKERSNSISTAAPTSSLGKSKAGSTSSRAKIREEERDDADWEVGNGAWLDAYDSEARKAERIRGMVLTPSRVKVLTKVGARNQKLRNVLQNALTHANESVWKELADALLEEHGSIIALETIVDLHLNDAITLDGNDMAVASATEVLKQEGPNEASFYILANVDGASRICDPSIARLVHEGLLNGSIGAIGCLSAHDNEENEVLERLLVAALELGGGTGTAAATLSKLGALGAVEKMAHLLPAVIVSMLDDTGERGEVVVRVGRIVAEVGTRDSDIVSLMKGALVLAEKKDGGNGIRDGNTIWKFALDKVLKEWTEQVKTGKAAVHLQ